MERLKSDDETVDRLRSLPESLIFEILSLLETKDVVRTSLLSKEWKDVWTTIPYLKFIDSVEKPVLTQDLINGVLQRWKGTKILRFKISILNALYDESLSEDIARWVAFAVEKKVEDLHVCLPYSSQREAPECLYSCSSITKLWLFGFIFPTEGEINVQWDKLKSLQMLGIVKNAELLHQLVSSAPQLQVLHAYLHTCSGSINIRSTCLKRVSIFNVSPSTYTTLTICAPNLEELQVVGEYKTSTRVVLDAPALTQFSLRFQDNIGDVQIHEESMKQLFLSIQNVKELALPLSIYKLLIEVMKGKCLFSNVKILKLISGGCDIQPSDIGSPADLFPNVEKLLIVLDASFKIKSRVTLFRRHDCGVVQQHSSDESEEEANSPKSSSFLLQLRRVEVTWCQSDNTDDLTYEFMMLLLKEATMVEQVVISKARECVLGSEEISTPKLLSLPSFFPTLDIIFS